MDSVEIYLKEFSYDFSPFQGSEYDRLKCAAWLTSAKD